MKSPASIVVRFIALSALCLEASAATVRAGSEDLHLDCAVGAAHDVRIPRAGNQTVISTAKQPAWAIVSETGNLLSVSTEGGTSLVVRIAVPYRYGTDRVLLQPGQSLSIARAAESNVEVLARVALRCDAEAFDPRRIEWLGRVAVENALLVNFLSAADSPALLMRVDALVANAGTPSDTALSKHLKAQALLMSGRTADTADAFAMAKQEWLALGDHERARVARVGRVEELQRLARHTEALALAGNFPAGGGDDRYMAARLRVSRCLTLRYLGRMMEALACFRDGVADMDRLGERLDLVSALQDSAETSLYVGNAVTAQRLGAEALAKCTLPAMETHRGRIEMMMADIAIELGDVQQALIHTDAALSEFAAAKSPRWEANALLRAAELYIELGATDEASDFVAAALTRLSERDAPARVAAARVTQARIDILLGRFQLAQTALRVQADTYARLQMPADLDSVHAMQVQLALLQGDVDGAAILFNARDRQQLLNAIQWRLIDAKLALRQNACSRSLEVLRGLQSQPLAVSAELERVEIHALCTAALGNAVGAQQQLMASAQRVISLAQRVGNPLLKQMLMQHIAPLRRAALAIALKPDATVPAGAADVWRWQQLPSAALFHATPKPSSAAAQFDAEVARQLLSARKQRGNGDARTSRSLLTVLAIDAAQRGESPAPREITLSSLQERLDAGNVFLSYADADDQSKLLWVTRNEARLLDAPNFRTLAAATQQLATSISSVNVPISVLDVNVSSASAMLLSALPASQQPLTLMIDAAGPLASLPWSALRWPGSDQPLIENTRVTLVRVAETKPRTASDMADVAVFVAAQEQSGPLAPLWNAGAEARLIADAMATGGKQVKRLSATHRDTLIDAFARATPWLHLASHGNEQKSHIGYSGVWLEPQSRNQSPRFVSWLGLLSRGAANDLVVLNACSLASGAAGRGTSFSFADEVSLAGARDVVAARWQISDSASALWVPAFYKSMSAGSGPAAALRSAQRRLRESRAFRHPFYWASYIHISRI